MRARPAADHFSLSVPSIVNETIPAFFIGRNKQGFWVARDVKGRRAEFSLFQNSALSFARKTSRPAGCATIFPSERFELDLENDGNPLIAHLGRLMHLASHPWRRMVVFANQMAKAFKHRLKDFMFFERSPRGDKGKKNFA